ncbi:MAG: ArsA family ATPase [Myxococcales bacterium]|nr:ArsA family ATPase [Myxococcales bacterium]
MTNRPTAPLLPSLFARRFVIISGKGGVGKSTISSALALAAARAGLRTCVLQLHTRDAIGRHFGSEQIGYDPVPLVPGLPLFGANLEPKQALREYGLMKLRFRALHRIVFENDVMRRLLRMIPGMNETFLLGKAWFMEEKEVDTQGRPLWDLLVVDAPSTGHGVSLFRLPEVLLQTVPVGPMAEDARRMRAMLTDPKRTSFNIVTLPQELPVNEAIDLSRQARESVGVPTGYLIANCVLPDLLPPIAPATLSRLARAANSTAVRGVVASTDHYLHWRGQQQAELQRLRQAAKLPVVELPHLLKPLDRQGIEHLSSLLLQAMNARPLPALESVQ